MRKVLLILILFVSGGALVWYFALGGADVLRRLGADEAPAPPVGRALDAGQTLAVAGAEELGEMVRAGERVLAILPPEVREQLPPALRGAASARETLGFDPTTAEGWRSIGLDPEVGVGVAFDRRLVPAPDGEPIPLVLARVTDWSKLLDLLERADEPVSLGDPADGVRVLHIGADRFLVGDRAGLTAALPVPEPLDDAAEDRLRAAFRVYLTGTEDTLARYEPFERAFRTGLAPPRSYFYAAAAPVVAFARGAGDLPAEVAGDAAFYAERFPALGATLGPEGAVARLLADPEGVRALRQLFEPRREPPDFARYVPREGHLAIRLSANLPTMFEGVAALMPPSAQQMKGRLALVRGFLPVVAGVSWEDMAAAFSGHAVVVTPLPGAAGAAALAPTPDEALVLVGVADPQKADAVLAVLLEKAATELGEGAREPIEIRGHTGFRVPLAPDVSAVVVRVEDVVLAALTPARLEAALDPADPSLEGTPAGRLLNADVLLAVAADVKSVTAPLAADYPDARPFDEFWQPLTTEGYLLAAIRVDDRGLLFAGGAAGIDAATDLDLAATPERSEEL